MLRNGVTCGYFSDVFCYLIHLFWLLILGILWWHGIQRRIRSLFSVRLNWFHDLQCSCQELDYYSSVFAYHSCSKYQGNQHTWSQFYFQFCFWFPNRWTVHTLQQTTIHGQNSISLDIIPTSYNSQRRARMIQSCTKTRLHSQEWCQSCFLSYNCQILTIVVCRWKAFKIGPQQSSFSLSRQYPVIQPDLHLLADIFDANILCWIQFHVFSNFFVHLRPRN